LNEKAGTAMRSVALGKDDAMNRKWTIAVLIAGLAGSLLFCQLATRKDKFVKIYLPQGGSITAELAVTDEERQRGLMFRETLLPDQGMLFVFETEDFYSFWMKNTLIPLDLLWLDKDRRIVHIARNVPPCKADPCPSYPPDRPGLYVLELAAGSADRLGLKIFDRLEFKL
jgi:uncharacterized membrane protein (UPF0127 family)